MSEPRMDFNKLTEAQAERLAVLTEELGEVLQAIGKIERHGYHSRNPLDLTSPTNQEALERELGDVTAAIGMLERARDIDARAVSLRAIVKTKNIIPWLHHYEAPDV